LHASRGVEVVGYIVVEIVLTVLEVISYYEWDVLRSL
jgi:hypothetical protein